MWKSSDDMVDERPAGDAPKRSLAQSVGERVRATRRARGLTLLELSRKCGSTPQTMQRLEAATMTMSLEWLEKICAALEVRPGAIVGEDPASALERRTIEIQEEAAVLRARLVGMVETLDAFLSKTGVS